MYTTYWPTPKTPSREYLIVYSASCLTINYSSFFFINILFFPCYTQHILDDQERAKFIRTVDEILCASIYTFKQALCILDFMYIYSIARNIYNERSGVLRGARADNHCTTLF